MKQPLSVVTIAFIAGILIANFSKASFVFTYVMALTCLLLSILSFKKKLLFGIFILSFFVFLGQAALKNSLSLPDCHISKLFRHKHKFPCIVKGFIADAPHSAGGKTSFVFRSQQIQDGLRAYTCCGNILVNAHSTQEFSYGEELILSGTLHRPFGRRSANTQSYRNYLYNKGIWFVMNVKTDADIVRLQKKSGFLLKKCALWLKKKMEAVISGHSSELSKAILGAMVLGEKRDIPWFVNDTMMKSGTIHILVVSGFNVGIVAFIITLFLKVLQVPKNARIFISALLLILYCLITGSSTPVVRATVMGVVFILAYLFKKEPQPGNSLNISALLILATNPKQLFDIGFQLSFMSVISILYLYPAAKRFLKLESINFRCLKFLIEGCLVSFCAWLGTSGFIAYYFKIFSPITPFANLLIVPLATLITLCGFSLLAMGWLLPWLTPLFSRACEFLIYLLLYLNSILIKIPLAYLRLS